MKAVRVNLFGGSSTKQRPDSEPRSLGDHGSVFRFLGSQLEGKILRGPMCMAIGDRRLNREKTFKGDGKSSEVRHGHGRIFFKIENNIRVKIRAIFFISHVQTPLSRVKQQHI